MRGAPTTAGLGAKAENWNGRTGIHGRGGGRTGTHRGGPGTCATAGRDRRARRRQRTREADANLHYVGDYQFYHMVGGLLAPVDAHVSLSGRVGYKMENGVTLALAGQNLLNERQKQTRGLEAERRIQFSVSKSW